MMIYLLYIFVSTIVAIIIAIVALTKIKGEDKYSNKKLDKVGIIFNSLLSILYIPLSLLSIVMGFFIWDAPLMNELDRIIRTIVTNISISMPFISIVSITLSIVLRKKGKSILSFCIQFLPIVMFILNIIFLTSLERF